MQAFGSVTAGGGLGAGHYLLDPLNVEIVSGSSNTAINGDNLLVPTGSTAQIGASGLLSTLASSNVTVTTEKTGGGEAGTITVQSPLAFTGSSASTLTLLDA